MPPRGNEGLDIQPILTHYVFLSTTILAVIGWIITLIGQGLVTSSAGHALVGELWFAIWLQLFLILGVLYTLASDSIAMHRFQVSVFGAIALVFAVIGVNRGIFARQSLALMSAGWLILAIVDIIWLLFFTSEEDSRIFYLFNLFGTGGLTPPSRRRRTIRTIPHMTNNGYAPNFAAGGVVSHDTPYEMKTEDTPGSPHAGHPGAGAAFPAPRSNPSLNRISPGPEPNRPYTTSPVPNPPAQYGGSPAMEPNRSFGSPMGGGSMPNISGGSMPNISLPDAGLAPRADPTTPLMGGAAGLGAGMGQGLSAGLGAPTGSPDIRSSSMTGTEPSQPSQPSQPENYVYKAKALYSYTAAADDPNELSFAKGEILDIVDKQGKWWQAKSASGRRGIAPSNYLQII